MKPRTTILLALLVFFQLPVFSQNNSLARYIPEKAHLVIAVNPMRIFTKLSAESFRQSAMYRELMKNPNSPVVALLNNPLETGVDFTSELLIYSNINEDHQKSTTLIGKLRSAELYAATMAKLIDNEKIKSYGTDKVYVNDNNAMAWNNQVFVITSGHESRDYTDFNMSDTSEEAMDKWMKASEEKAAKAARDACFEALTIKNSNLATNPQFATWLNTTADFKTWDTGGGNNTKNMFLPMGELLSELQSFVSGTKTAFINFEDGKIVAKTYNYLKGEMAELYKKYPPAPIDVDMLKRLPEGKILGILNVAYNSDMAKELFEKALFRKIFDSLKTHISFDVSEMVDMFKNNMVLAVMQSDAPYAKGGIEMVLATPIGDMEKFKRVGARLIQLYDSLKTAQKKSQEEDEENGTHSVQYNPFKNFEPSLKNNDKYFVFALAPETAEAFLKNPGENAPPAWMLEYQYPMLMHVNLRQIIEMVFAKTKKHGEDDPGMKETVLTEVFKDVIIYGGHYKDEAVQTTVEFRFSDPNKNSLKQFFEFINKMAEQSMERRRYWEEHMKDNISSDSTAISIDTTVNNIMPEAPQFKDPKTQAALTRYAEIMAEYMTAGKDAAKRNDLIAKMNKWSEENKDVWESLANDPAEMKKFTDWTAKIASYLSGQNVIEVTLQDIKQEDEKIPPPPPPPPPKVEMKKATTTPVKKKGVQ